MALVALTREVSPSLARCELTHLARLPIDVELARAQHGDYERRLAGLGCEVRRLPAEPAFPDAVFVEDVAVVLDEVAIMGRPGAESRRGEVASVAEVLGGYRPLGRIEAPGTLDGGDVLVVGKLLYAGLSGRTNRAGVEQLEAAVAPWGYRVRPVPVTGCLHLKSAASAVADHTLLIQRSWVDPAAFAGLELIDVAPTEPWAANALRIGEVVVFPSAYRETGERLERHGIAIVTVELSELAKAEGGVTCCSLIYRTGPASGRPRVPRKPRRRPSPAR